MPVVDKLCGREGKGREGKGREGKGREGKGREGKGRELVQWDCTFGGRGALVGVHAIPAALA